MDGSALAEGHMYTQNSQKAVAHKITLSIVTRWPYSMLLFSAINYSMLAIYRNVIGLYSVVCHESFLKASLLLAPKFSQEFLTILTVC
jgi:hypothetical protein